ncbi:NAD-dependent epimerase/dehydratase family protein [Candidatus Neomarinimicrobiota bacterium]
MSSIAVVGGGGYLGQILVDHLIERGHAVHVFVRKNAEILVRNPGAIIVGDTPPEGGFDVVVNLAYPSGGKAFRAIKENKAILGTLQKLAGKNTRIIHTSTLAVFGFALEQEQSLSLLKKRRDYPYVELKMDMEYKLLKAFKEDNLDIVRLGNIWGPGSPHWTAALADKILFGHPVLIEGEDGYSNITDVNNVASYIAFLAELPEPSSMTFHHLAELSNIKWSFWINHFSQLLKVEPISIDSKPNYPKKIVPELRDIFANRKRGGGLPKALWGSRFMGSYLRSLLAKLPNFVVTYIDKKFNSGVEGGSSSDLFYTLMSCPVRYENVVDNRWKPALDAEGSWEKVELWAAEVGYLV